MFGRVWLSDAHLLSSPPLPPILGRITKPVFRKVTMCIRDTLRHRNRSNPPLPLPFSYRPLSPHIPRLTARCTRAPRVRPPFFLSIVHRLCTPCEIGPPPPGGSTRTSAAAWCVVIGDSSLWVGEWKKRRFSSFLFSFIWCYKTHTHKHYTCSYQDTFLALLHAPTLTPLCPTEKKKNPCCQHVVLPTQHMLNRMPLPPALLLMRLRGCRMDTMPSVVWG